MEKSKFETLNPNQGSSSKRKIQNILFDLGIRIQHVFRISSLGFGIFILLGLGHIPFLACQKETPSKSVTSQTAKVLYHCPMHPTYISDKPGDCPICGMRLVPIEDKTTGRYSDSSSAEVVAGRTAIGLSLERQQLIGVRSLPVTKRNLEKTIRTVGEIAYDPELYAVIAEYQQALKTKTELTSSPIDQAREGSDALLKAAQLKLRLMGLSDGQIRELTATSDKPVNLLVGTEGRVWVYAQIYEYEMSYVKAGQTVEVTTQAYPGQVFTGRIKALDPVLNPETRSLRVRAEVENRFGFLKPQMFLDVKIRVPLGELLALPEDAVIDTGERTIVFIDRGDGMFEPRAVELGQEAEGYFSVRSGISVGEKVVTQANFLVDSESRMKAALLKMSTDQGSSIHYH